MSSKRRASKRQVTAEAFDEESFERFYQAHKRLKVASDAKDEEIASLKVTLEETKTKEEESRKNYDYATTFRVDWLDRYEEEREKVVGLRVTISNLEMNVRSLEAENERLREDGEHSTSSVAAKCEQLEIDKDALQNQLAKIEQEHKELLREFDVYKGRLRKMSNEA